MGDILSQSEIDALLNALTTGEIDASQQPDETKEKVVKKHDFARPSKFGKDQLRTLEIIFDNYARLTTSFLTNYLRSAVTIEVVGSEQITYGEFANSMSTPVILSIIDFAPLKGSIALDLSPNIGYAIIDRVLGGDGRGLKSLRDFSEIEKVLLERIVIQFLSFLVEPFENVARFEPRLEKIETNPQFAQIIAPSEMIALVTLKIKFGNVEGFANYCLPYIVIEPIVDKLNTRLWFKSETPSDLDTRGYKSDIEAKLDDAKIPVKSILGRTRIMISDFVSLQVGDIITLDTFINNDVEIHVGDLLRFQGKPGISKGKNAIQITKVLRKEE